MYYIITLSGKQIDFSFNADLNFNFDIKQYR